MELSKEPVSLLVHSSQQAKDQRSQVKDSTRVVLNLLQSALSYGTY